MQAGRVVALIVTLSACGGAGGPGRLRFHNRPPVELVNDRRPIPRPKFSELGLVQYYFREDLIRPAVGALALRRHRPAADVNSLGNVPDSAWFVNRIGGPGGLSPDELRRGPGRGGTPSAPWRVDGMKVGGAAIGFTVRDASGERFVVKFDERAFPETESAADVIVQRLIWAFGYNVPENDVVDFDCDALKVAADATYEAQSGQERPMTQADVDRFLDLVRPASGPCRALFSRFIEGKPVGGITPHGVRRDDPNDTIPHQHRRVLRAQKVLFAWVDHVDVKPKNSFVAYDREARHLIPYFLDFGKSLGTFARVDGAVYIGYRTHWGFKAGLRSLVSLGLWVPPWEARYLGPGLRGVGYFDADSFAPSRWTQHHRWTPFDVADRFDDYWAGVILMKLTPAHVRAAVEAGRYSDPRATEYVTRVLLERQRKLGRWTLSRVAPFEELTVEGDRGGRFALCFEDLWVRHRFGAEGQTVYRATVYDYDGTQVATSAASPRRGSAVCIPRLPAAAERDGYTIVRIAAVRGSSEVPDIYVHLARAPGGALAVIGIDRR
jgi:hypothetical protein